MRRTTEAIVRSAAPVLSVVLRFKTRQTKVRDFVMLIAGRANSINHDLVHPGREIVVGFWPHPTANLIGEWCAFVYIQQVERQMLRSQIQSEIEISFPTCQRLPG